METTDIINELRAEIAALSARIDELEKQLADNEELADAVEPAMDIEDAADTGAVAEAEPAAALDLDIEIDKHGASPLPDLHNFQWMTDMPGSEVANIISGISLNDRVLFINTLFREDPGLFQSPITSLNGMKSIEDAVASSSTCSLTKPQKKSWVALSSSLAAASTTVLMSSETWHS